MDSEQIRIEVFRRTGKSIDLEDPFFVAVEMLSVVTDDMTQRHASMIVELRKENARLRETGLKIGPVIDAINNAGRRVANESPSNESIYSGMLLNSSAMRRDVTAWLDAADKKLNSFVLVQFASSLVTGIIGGVVVLIVPHIFHG